MVAAMLLLSACSSEHCNGSNLPYRKYAYLDKQVYVYRTATLFTLLEPQMLPDADQKLAPVVAYAKAHPELAIMISAYGDNAYNSVQSTEQRDFAAETVAAKLWASGVKNAMQYKGFKGGTHSVSSNRVASSGVANRRIEIEFYDKNVA